MLSVISELFEKVSFFFIRCPRKLCIIIVVYAIEVPNDLLPVAKAIPKITLKLEFKAHFCGKIENVIIMTKVYRFVIRHILVGPFRIVIEK